MSIVIIPAGLCIGNREIDLEIEYSPDADWCEAFQTSKIEKNIKIARIKLTFKIRAALEAAAKYQAEIGE